MTGAVHTFSPPNDSDLEDARLELAVCMNQIIGLFTSRRDVLVSMVWDQPADTLAAWFQPGTGLVTINGDAAIGEGTHPDDVDPTTQQGRLTHPTLIGLLVHEAGGHAEHSLWLGEVTEDTPPVVLRAAHLLEEPRAEARHLAGRPTDRLYLRAVLHQILLATPWDVDPADAVAARWQAAAAAVLVLGRVDAGVVDAAEVTGLQRKLTAMLGADLDRLRAVWRKALAVGDDDTAAMLDLAGQWCAIVGVDPDDPCQDRRELPGPTCAHGQDAQAAGQPPRQPTGGRTGSALADAVAEAVAAIADEDATITDEALARHTASQADQTAAAAKAAETAEQSKADADAAAVFGRAAGIGAGGSPVTGTRPPTDEERAEANRLAAVLRRARFRTRSAQIVPSEVPPGRLSGRDAMLATGQRKLGLPVTALPYRQRRTWRAQEPPTSIGIVVDVSQSMGHITGPMSSAAWILAHAARRAGGRSATVAFGDNAYPIINPGATPTQVSMFSASQGTRAFSPAVRAVDGALNLATGSGARLLVIASDGELFGSDLSTGRRLITRLAHLGVTVLWLDFDGRTTVLDGATSVDLRGAGGSTAAEAIASATAHALRLA